MSQRSLAFVSLAAALILFLNDRADRAVSAGASRGGWAILTVPVAPAFQVLSVSNDTVPRRA